MFGKFTPKILSGSTMEKKTFSLTLKSKYFIFICQLGCKYLNIFKTFSSYTKTSQFSVSQHKCKHSTFDSASALSKNFAPNFRDSAVLIIMSLFTSNFAKSSKYKKHQFKWNRNGQKFN